MKLLFLLVIGGRYLLSSASCLLTKDRQRVEFMGNLFAAAGLRHDLRKAYLNQSNFRKISEVFIHPEFDKAQRVPGEKRPDPLAILKHDLAILKLSESFKLGTDIAPGCLFNLSKNEFESDLIVAGFGDTTTYDPRLGQTIQTYPPSMAYVRQTSNCSASLVNFNDTISLCAISNCSTIKRGDGGL